MGACTENWNSMAPVNEGRFCSRCQHAVVDFTGWSQQAVLNYKLQHPDACGLYDTERIEPHLVPLVDLLRPTRSVLVAGLALGSLHVAAQSDAPANTEQAPNVPSAAPASSAQELVHDKPDGVYGTCPMPETTPTRLHKRPYRRFYVSKRFPFIHIKRRYTMGRFAFHPHSRSSRSMVVGTPSF